MRTWMILFLAHYLSAISSFVEARPVAVEHHINGQQALCYPQICLAGTQVQICESGDPAGLICVPCPDGTFMDRETHSTEGLLCFLRDPCSENAGKELVQLAEDATKDNVCRCRKGYQDPDYDPASPSATRHKCNWCPEDHRYLGRYGHCTNCTSEVVTDVNNHKTCRSDGDPYNGQNTVEPEAHPVTSVTKSPESPKTNTALIIGITVGVIIILIVIIVVVVLCRRHKRWSRNSTKYISVGKTNHTTDEPTQNGHNMKPQPNDISKEQNGYAATDTKPEAELPNPTEKPKPQHNAPANQQVENGGLKVLPPNSTDNPEPQNDAPARQQLQNTVSRESTPNADDRKLAQADPQLQQISKPGASSAKSTDRCKPQNRASSPKSTERPQHQKLALGDGQLNLKGPRPVSLNSESGGPQQNFTSLPPSSLQSPTVNLSVHVYGGTINTSGVHFSSGDHPPSTIQNNTLCLQSLPSTSQSDSPIPDKERLKAEIQLRKCRTQIVDALLVKAVLPKLREDNLLSLNDQQLILHEKTDMDQSGYLLDMICRKPNGAVRLIEIMKDDFRHLWDAITETNVTDEEIKKEYKTKY